MPLQAPDLYSAGICQGLWQQHESMKRATKCSAYYFTLADSHYQVPGQIKVPPRDIPKIKRLPVCAMSKQDQDYMCQWASEHGKAVR